MDAIDLQLLAVIQTGIPLTTRPYAQIAAQIALSETQVIQRLKQLKKSGLIKRLGVIVKHRALGYKANAMVVFNVPDTQVNTVGQQMSQFNFINLCYLRPRQGEHWPYNLFCMIHGKNREAVLKQLKHLMIACQLTNCMYEVLFSQRCFKQRGAYYHLPNMDKSQ